MCKFRILILLILAFDTVSAQDGDLRFEVASVRPSAPPGRGVPPVIDRRIDGPGRLTYQRTLFRKLVMDAYRVQRDQIEGPDWAIADAVNGGALFEVSAIFPVGSTSEQIATMLRNLLKDRFNLSLSHTTHERRGWALSLAQRGSKLRRSAGPVSESERGMPINGRVVLKPRPDGYPDLFPDRNMGGAFTNGTVRLRFRDYPLSDLVQQLSFALGVRIVDKTGLRDKYDFTLDFTPPESGAMVGKLVTLPLAQGQEAPLNAGLPSSGQLDSIPTISSALESQLGLKLATSTIALPMLIIKHADRTPTEN